MTQNINTAKIKLPKSIITRFKELDAELKKFEENLNQQHQAAVNQVNTVKSDIIFGFLQDKDVPEGTPQLVEDELVYILPAEQE